MGFYSMKMGRSGFLFKKKSVGVDYYIIKIERSGYLYNKNGPEWLGVGFFQRKWVRVARGGFLYNENGSEWLGVARSIKW